MGWFREIDLNKIFKIFLENGDKFEAVLKEINGEILEFILLDGRVRKIKNKKIDEVIESNKNISLSNNDNMIEEKKYLQIKYDIKSDIKYHYNIEKLNLKYIKKENSFLYTKIYNVLNKLKYAIKIKELNLKYNRASQILKELLSILKEYDTVDDTIEPMIIYILKYNNISFSDFFKEQPFTKQCIMYDIDFFYKKNHNEKVFNLILLYFGNYILTNSLKNFWLFCIDNCIVYEDYNCFKLQIDNYSNFTDIIKQLFFESLKYIIFKLDLPLNPLYRSYLENKTLNYKEIKELVNILTLKVISKQKEIDISFIKKEVNNYLEKYLYEDAYEYIASIYENYKNDNIKQLKNKISNYLHKWKKFKNSLPKDEESPNYIRAKHYHLIYNDIKKASEYFEYAIEEFEPKYTTAIKDYIQMYQPIDKKKALELAEKYKKPQYIQGKEEKITFNNLLISIYEQNNDLLSALQVLNQTINQIESKEYWLKNKYKKSMKNYYFKQGALYLKLEKNYQKAIKAFKNAIKFGADEMISNRNIALCYLGAGQKDEAKKLLEKNIKKFADIEAQEILKSDVFIEKESQTTQSQIDILINKNIDYSTEFSNVDKFIQFYLDSCEYIGVSANKKQNKTFTEYDYKNLLDLDRIKSSKEKADRTLTAVLIGKYLNKEELELNTKLVESLRFKANYYIQNGKFDIAKNYLLTILNQLENIKKDDFFLLAILIDYFHTVIKNGYTGKVDKKVFLNVLQEIQNNKQIKNLIINLRLYSKKAFDVFFNILQTKKELYDIYDNTLNLKIIQNSRNLYEKLEIDLKIISSKNIDDKIIIEILEKIDKSFLFDLDSSYFEEFKNIFIEFQNIFNSNRFEEKELVIEKTKNRFEKLLERIESEPTIFSINNLRDLIKLFLDKLKKYEIELKKSKLPKIELRTPLEKYTKKGNSFDFHLNILNGEFLSPAKDIKIYIYYKNNLYNEKIINRLSGGDNKTLEISIKNIQEEIFSLNVKVEYSDVFNNVHKLEKDFPISLEEESAFEEIFNPYVPDGDIVKNKEMFFGRDKLIDKLIYMLYNNTIKGVILYGQKRVGKSSVFHHLKEKINQKQDKFFVIYFSMGEVDGFESLIRRIVFKIGREYKKLYKENLFDILCIKRNSVKTLSDLFEFLDIFKEHIEKQNLELLILIDEFTYIYGAIKDGRYPVDFLKNWKALSQNNLFKSALIGQNSMPMFINEFPNELAVYKKEKISYLDKESAYQLIENPILLPSGESRYKDEAKELIYKYTHGSPYYIQKICNELVNYLNEKKSKYITSAHIKNVIDLMFKSMKLEGDFDNLITIGDGADKKIEELRKEIIIQIALKSKNIGSASFDDIVIDANEETKKNIIKTLIETDIVQVINNRYKLVVKLLEEFIQKTYNFGE